MHRRRRRQVPPRLLDRPHVTRGPAHKVHLSLAFNPSHLEAVNPVVAGARARQAGRLGDATPRARPADPVHGDAAFAGQGHGRRGAEPVRAAGLPHRRHGPRHRQQPDRLHHLAAATRGRRRTHRRRADARGPDLPRQRRGSRRRSPRSASWRSTSASAFGRDVVIDMYCYRKLRPQRGRRAALHPAAHVPGDQRQAVGPRGSTPHDAGRRRRSPRARPTIIVEATDAIAAHKRRRSRRAGIATRLQEPPAPQHVRRRVGGLSAAGATTRSPEVTTGVPREMLEEIAERCTSVPAGLQRRTPRSRASSSTRARRWGRREADRLGHGRGARVRLAAGQGTRVRLSGQDSRRGTFSHRHAVLVRLQRRARVHAARAHRATGRRRSRSTTARCRRRACSASSTATGSTCPTGW